MPLPLFCLAARRLWPYTQIKNENLCTYRLDLTFISLAVETSLSKECFGCACDVLFGRGPETTLDFFLTILNGLMGWNVSMASPLSALAVFHYLKLILNGVQTVKNPNQNERASWNPHLLRCQWTRWNAQIYAQVCWCQFYRQPSEIRRVACAETRDAHWVTASLENLRGLVDVRVHGHLEVLG